MNHWKRMAVAALAAGLGACGQGDGNVMGAGANSLTPAQVDAALGPEVANEAGNALNTTDVNAVEAVERPVASEPAARRPAPPVESRPAEEPEDDEPDTPVQEDSNAI